MDVSKVKIIATIIAAVATIIVAIIQLFNNTVSFEAKNIKSSNVIIGDKNKIDK